MAGPKVIEDRIKANAKVASAAAALGSTGALLSRSPRLGVALGIVAGGVSAVRFAANAGTSVRQGGFLKTEGAALAGSVATTLVFRKLFAKRLGRVSFSKKPIQRLARAGGQARAQRAIRKGAPIGTTSSGVRFVRVRGRIIPIRTKLPAVG